LTHSAYWCTCRNKDVAVAVVVALKDSWSVYSNITFSWHYEITIPEITKLTDVTAEAFAVKVSPTAIGKSTAKITLEFAPTAKALMILLDAVTEPPLGTKLASTVTGEPVTFVNKSCFTTRVSPEGTAVITWVSVVDS